MERGLQPLILASSSPWRRALLENAGIPCRCVSPDVDERATQIEDPIALVRELARQKAAAVAREHPDALVLAADQMLFDAAGVFGKPESPEDHLARLRAMRGMRHELVTGITILGRNVEIHDHAITALTMRGDLTDDELRAYVESGEGSGCAGGYTIEGHGVFLFADIEGDWFNIVGLPIRMVITHLRSLGLRYPWATGGINEA